MHKASDGIQASVHPLERRKIMKSKIIERSKVCGMLMVTLIALLIPVDSNANPTMVFSGSGEHFFWFGHGHTKSTSVSKKRHQTPPAPAEMTDQSIKPDADAIGGSNLAPQVPDSVNGDAN